MVAIGLILLVLAVAVALGIALDNTSEVDVSLFGQDLSGLTQGTLFLLGVATGFVAALALGLILSGLKRRRTKKLAHKRQVHAARSDAETLAEENARLQDEPGLPEPVAAPSGRETVLQSTGGLLGDEQLLRSIAGALVLMLAAGHLRSWLSRSRPDDLA